MNNYEPVEILDKITEEASILFKVPIAMINLVTDDSVIFKSCTGLSQGGRLDRFGSFCSLASSQQEPLLVSNATTDARFSKNDLVRGQLQIRSYMGKSLRGPNGQTLGTLCLLDTKPRRYSKLQMEALMAFAARAEEAFKLILLPSAQPA